MEFNFDHERTKAACRVLHEAGVEKTPDQLRAFFWSMIADYRRWHPDLTHNKNDSEAWDMIRELIDSSEC